MSWKMNGVHRWRMDSSAHTTPVDSEIVNENWVATDLEIVIETASRNDAWIC